FDFLEVPDDDQPAPRLTPELRLERIFSLLRRATQRRSDREVLVLLLEDLHWFDAASRSFVERLIPSFPGTRTLVLTNFRPEFSPPWSAHSYYRQLPLRPLDPEAVGLRLASAGTASAGDVAGALGRLCTAEFLQVVGDGPLDVEEYRFWHPLTQDVAYRTLLRDRRAALHAAVARAIIVGDPDRRDERS